MKKILLSSLIIFGALVGSNVSAQVIAPYIQKCTDPSGNIITCTMGGTPGRSTNVPNVSQPNMPSLNVPTPNLNFVAPDVNGSYDSRYPGDVFAFCSGSRPGRKSSKRPIYDFICPKGKL